MTEDADRLEVDEETEIGWRQYLDDFHTEVWPIFQRYGYSRDAALLAWMMNRLHNVVTDLVDGD